MTLEHLHRAHRADPTNTDAALAYARERARIEGPGVLLDPLGDRERWAATPEVVQDLAIAEVGRRLRGRFEHTQTRVWRCDNTRLEDCPECGGEGGSLGPWGRLETPCDDCGGTGKVDFVKRVSHRCATFRHVATGMEMNLIPGVTPRCEECGGAAKKCRFDGMVADESIPPALVGRWPVTVRQFDLMLLGEHYEGDPFDPAKPSPDGDLPRTLIAHETAREVLVSHGLRIPISAEWSHACRAGTTTGFYFGDEIDDAHCWHAGNSGEPCSPASRSTFPDCIHCDGHCFTPRPHAPAEHDQAAAWNAFGLVDTVGNVWEWATDGRELWLCGGSYSSRLDQFGHPWTDLDGGAAQNVGFRAFADVPDWRAP